MKNTYENVIICIEFPIRMTACCYSLQVNTSSTCLTLCLSVLKTLNIGTRPAVVDIIPSSISYYTIILFYFVVRTIISPNKRSYIMISLIVIDSSNSVGYRKKHQLCRHVSSENQKSPRKNRIIMGIGTHTLAARSWRWLDKCVNSSNIFKHQNADRKSLKGCSIPYQRVAYMEYNSYLNSYIIVKVCENLPERKPALSMLSSIII